MIGALPPLNPRTGISLRRADLPLGVDFVSVTLSGHQFPPHVHEGYTVGLVESGCLEYWCGGEVRVCPPGSLILMNPGEVHTGRAHPGLGLARYHVIYPKAEVVRTLLGDSPPLGTFRSSDRALVCSFRRLAAAAGSTGQAARDQLAATLQSVFESLCERPSATEVRRRRELVDVIRMHLLDSIQARPDLARLAHDLGLHPGYLRRLFAETTGLSPRSYLLQLRVMRARQLLGKGVPIAHVVGTAGFADQAHLTHEFKRTMGFPPGRFQEELGYR